MNEIIVNSNAPAFFPRTIAIKTHKANFKMKINITITILNMLF